MKKILFGITSLTLGGAERVLVDVVNKLNNDYNITIFTLYPNGEFEKMISSNVNIVSLYSKPYKKMTKLQKIGVSLRLFFSGNCIYSKFIKRNNYDTEIAFLEGPITRLFSIKNKNTKKIAWVHNDISQVFGDSLKARIKVKYDKKVYNKYDTIVFVSKDNLDKFKILYPTINENRLKLIYNYIDAQNVRKKANSNLDIEFEDNKINFVTVARLTKQKAIDRLLKVHIDLIKNGFVHNIYVIGEGPEKEILEKTIKENKVQDTFKLLGKKGNPYPYIKNADVFCLLSSYEGYGMVLEEAKILDKFIIITDTAAREAIQDYEKSIIVDNNEEAIYKGLKEIIQNNVKTDKETIQVKLDKVNKGNKKNKKNEQNKENKTTYDNSEILEKIRNIL